MVAKKKNDKSLREPIVPLCSQVQSEQCLFQKHQRFFSEMLRLEQLECVHLLFQIFVLVTLEHSLQNAQVVSQVVGKVSN